MEPLTLPLHWPLPSWRERRRETLRSSISVTDTNQVLPSSPQLGLSPHSQPSLPSDYRCWLHFTSKVFTNFYHKLLHIVCIHLQVRFEALILIMQEKTQWLHLRSKKAFRRAHLVWYVMSAVKGMRPVSGWDAQAVALTPPPYPTTPGPGNWSSFNVGLKSCLMGRKKLFPAMGKGEEGDRYGLIYSIKDEAMDSWEPKSRAVYSKLWMFGNSTQKFLYC